MARRGQLDDSDSLELLLDTICNVFGGIVLMAILVVLQTQQTVARIPTPDAASVERALEARRTRFEIDAAENRVGDLVAQRQRILATQEAVGTDSTPRLIEAYADFNKAITEAEARVDELQKRLSKARGLLAESDAKHADARRQLEGKQDEVEHLKRQLHNLAKRPRRSLRLPHRGGAARGTPRYFVIKGTRVYRFGAGHLPSFTGAAYWVEDCHVIPTTAGDRISAEVTTGNGGFAFDDAKGPAQLGAALSQYAASSHYVLLFVYRDSVSYQTFQRVRKSLTVSGYRYAVAALLQADGPFPVAPTAYHETE